MGQSVFLLCILIFSAARDALSLDCGSDSTRKSILHEYMYLSEEAMAARLDEWSLFCKSQPNGTNLEDDIDSLRALWRSWTGFHPLSVCPCFERGSSSSDVEAYIPPSLFVDYPVLGVIILILLYLLRIYHDRRSSAHVVQPPHGDHLHEAGDGGDRGAQLLRYVFNPLCPPDSKP